MYFGVVIDANGLRLAAPRNDVVEAVDRRFRRQRKINLDPQSFVIEVIQHIQQAEGKTEASGTSRHNPQVQLQRE